ncbi:MAG TPA: phytase [Ardenticatenaceae bacterium]|nr:phytase [Ardenticatenaceae bacterium]
MQQLWRTIRSRWATRSALILAWAITIGVAGTTVYSVAAEIYPLWKETRTSAAMLGVAPTVETEPMPHTGDSADDPAIWIHPSDPSLSVIVATDKQGGIAVYELDGQQLEYYADGGMNNVDLRYNFPLGSERVALVAASNHTNNTIAVYRVNPATRGLENVAAGRIALGNVAYGFCLYHSPVSGKYYAFNVSEGGSVEQWELFDDGSGKVDALPVRTFTVGSKSEGCIADDELGSLYVGEEDVGIWKYGAEPDDTNPRILVDGTGTGGHLVADVEGLAIYYTSEGTGYLIASSQGNRTFAVYRREGHNPHVMTFTVEAGNGIDGVSITDGIEVTNFGLGPSFSQGLFIAQDGYNSGGNQNFKLVPWPSIAAAASPPLAIDTSWDPRGADPGSSPLPSATRAPSRTPTRTASRTPTRTPTRTATPVGANPTFLPEADARVDARFPDTNYGAITTLRVDGGADPAVESYLRFNLAGLSGPVLRATLRIFTSSGTSDGPAVYPTSNEWSETALTWNNRPERTGPAVDDEETIASNHWVEFDVTPLVTGNGTYSFVLATTSTDGLSFSSREVEAGPQLLLELGVGADPPAPPVAPASPTPTSRPAETATPIVTVAPATVDVRIAQGADDAEERGGDGAVNHSSSDLELTTDPDFGGEQTIGLRFQNVTIPLGASIRRAYIEFTSDDADDVATGLTFYVEDSDETASFTTSTGNISGRLRSPAVVAWENVPAWTAPGLTYQTPDLSALIQTVVDRPGWTSGNALAFIVTGSGKRQAKSYDGAPEAAPRLHVEYTSPSPAPATATSTIPPITPTVAGFADIHHLFLPAFVGKP